MTSIEWNDNGNLRSMRFDAVLQEQHDQANIITEHPTELGQPIADHVRNQADRLTLECQVTNSPVEQPTTHNRGARMSLQSIQLDMPPGRAAAGEGPVTVSVYAFDGEIDRVSDIFAELTDLKQRAIPLTIDMTLRTYDDMIVETFSTPRDSASGNSITFSLALKNVRTVQTQSVAPTAPTKQPAHKGPKAVAPLDPKTDKQEITDMATAFGLNPFAK